MKKIIKIIAIMLSILFCFSNLYCYAISNTDDKNVYDNAKATEEFEEKEDISNGTESKEIQEVCGITKNLHSHLARHTCGTLLLNAGCDIMTVSKVLGHSSTKITDNPE